MIIRDTFRALLASNLSFEAMLVFADALEEYGEGLRLGGRVSARELAAAYRWAGEKRVRPGEDEKGAWFWNGVLFPYRLTEYLPEGPRFNRHRAFLRLAMALREYKKTRIF